MSSPEQQTNTSNLQTLETEMFLTRQELEDFRKLPKKEQEEKRKDKITKLKVLQDRLDKAIEEAIKNGQIVEAEKLREEFASELDSLEELVNDEESLQYKIELLTGQVFTDTGERKGKEKLFEKREKVSSEKLKEAIKEIEEQIGLTKTLSGSKYGPTEAYYFSEKIGNLIRILSKEDVKNRTFLRGSIDMYRTCLASKGIEGSPVLKADSFAEFYSGIKKRFEGNLDVILKKENSMIVYVNGLAPFWGWEAQQIMDYYYLSELNLVSEVSSHELQEFSELMIWYEKRMLEITVEFYKKVGILDKDLPKKDAADTSELRTAVGDLYATEALYQVLIKAGVDLGDIEDVEKVMNRIKKNIKLQQ